MKNPPKSFISEHTVEFAILPSLMTYLADRFGNAIPLYFWSSQEGNSQSEINHENLNVRILAVFARRPKTNPVATQSVFLKLNMELFRFAARASATGIPVIAGVPLARSLIELSPTADPVWLGIGEHISTDVVLETDIENRKFVGVWPESTELPSIISKHEVAQIIEEKAKRMTWSNAIEIIRTLNRDAVTSTHHQFFMRRSYRPVYVVVFDI